MPESFWRTPRGERISRRSALAALGAATLPFIAGCGDEDDDSAPTAAPMQSNGSPVAGVPGFDDPRRWAGRVLRIGAWGGEIQLALRDRVWNAFTLATGCAVQEVRTDYSQLATPRAQSGAAYADVLLVDAFWAYGALERGAVEPIPAEAIDRRRFAPTAVLDGAVPAYAYAMVSAFRRDAVPQAGGPDSWAQWWDPAALPGARSLPNGPLGCFEFALLADGVERDDLYPIDSARAIEKLRQIVGEIGDRWWSTGDQPIDWMSRQEAQLAAAWHYRVIASQLDGRPLDFVWDDALLVADQWVVPKSTPVLDVALDYLAFASTPEVQASLAASVPLGPVVEDAFGLIDARTATRLPTAPENRDRMVRADVAWWAANEVDANEQFKSQSLGIPMIGT